MSRRTRAIAFAGLALAAAAVGAALVAGYGSRVAGGYGPLRPVVVLRASLESGQRIGPRDLERDFELRRVPLRFVPPGTLAVPADALGLVTRGPAPAGSYLLPAQPRPPSRHHHGGGLGAGPPPGAIAGSRPPPLFPRARPPPRTAGRR